MKISSFVNGRLWYLGEGKKALNVKCEPCTGSLEYYFVCLPLTCQDTHY